jgi:uncharacterized membrane protein (DUF485 family)
MVNGYLNSYECKGGFVMALVTCFKCGKVNRDEIMACDFCGNPLLSGKEYVKKLQELQDYIEFRKKNSLLGIILITFLLLLMYPVVKRLVQATFTVMGTEFLPGVVLEYSPLAMIILTFVIVVLPMIFRRWNILRRYRWTSRRNRIKK